MAPPVIVHGTVLSLDPDRERFPVRKDSNSSWGSMFPLTGGSQEEPCHPGGFCSRPDKALFDPNDTANAVNWTYVGHGNGGYEKVESYNYVGGGTGSFKLETVATPYGFRMRPICCFLLATVAVVIVALASVPVLQLVVDARTATTTTMPLMAAPPTTSSPVPEPYDCMSAGPWSLERREYCCRMHQRGCDAAPRPPAPTATPAAAPISQSPPALPAAAAQQREETTPPPAPPAAVTSPPAFDCHDGLGHFEELWPAVKQTWCCKHEQLGCPSDKPTEPAYDCNDFRSVWEDDQKMWCCEHRKMGCQLWTKSSKAAPSQASQQPPAEEPAAPAGADEEEASAQKYDCSSDIADWETKWSDAKKAWCSHSCQHGVACPHSH